MILGGKQYLSFTCLESPLKVSQRGHAGENLPLSHSPATQVTSLSGLSSLDYCGSPLWSTMCFSGKDQQKVTGGASLECHPHRLWCVTQSYRGQSSCVVCSSVKQVLTCHWLFASVSGTRSSGVRWLCAWQSLPYGPTCEWFQDFQALQPCAGDCFQLMAGQREGDRMHGKMSQVRHENAALPSITHWLELSTFTENVVSLVPRRKRRWGSRAQHCLSHGHIKDEIKQ